MPGGRGLFDRVPDHVSVYEVGLRDGLQNEARPLSADDKLALLDALLDAGVRRLELTSFVSPRWIPQLADADDVVRRAPRRDDVSYGALCPNAKGLERARAAGLSEIAVFLSASETHNRKNLNRGIEDTLAVLHEVVGPARDAGLRVRGYVSTVWGCPYEGDVDPARAVDIARRLVELGCYQVSLGDTIGVGTPRQTAALLRRFLDEVPRERIALHFHDTRGTALANALVGLELGIRELDASIGGLGGCPYAPGAAGNLATEDLVYMLHGMGVETGIDLPKLIEAGHLAERLLRHPLPGKVRKAGAFTRREP